MPERSTGSQLLKTISMKQLFLFLFLLAGGSLLAQKTVHDPHVQLRNVSSFTEIRVSGGIDVLLTQGDEAVAVSASEPSYRDHIVTTVEDGVLTIRYDWKQGRNILLGTDKKLKAYVSYKTLNRISASGGSDVHVEGVFRGDKVSVEISGGSDLKGAIAVKELRVSQSGGSDVTVSGSAGTVNISASGGSDFEGFDLVTETCTVEASGGSDVTVTVNRELSARASGASDISYKGNPSVKVSSSSGASSVSRKS